MSSTKALTINTLIRSRAPTIQRARCSTRIITRYACKQIVVVVFPFWCILVGATRTRLTADGDIIVVEYDELAGRAVNYKIYQNHQKM